MACQFCEVPISGPGVHAMGRDYTIINCPTCGDIVAVFGGHVGKPKDEYDIIGLKTRLGMVANKRIGRGRYHIDEEQICCRNHYHLHARRLEKTS